MDGIDLIDVLLEDDFLISSATNSATDLCPAGLIEQCHVHDYSHEDLKRDEKLESSMLESKQVDRVPQFSESPEVKRKSSKINLRKSLAWDSAFFTSEGVLDNEELAMVNSTYRKKELNVLPQIQEDLRTSADSSSTLDSDSQALENLETDLFDNLRASIQKSYGNSDKASNLLHPCRRQQQQLDTTNSASSRTTGTSSAKMDHFKKPGISNTKKEETLLNGSLSKQPSNKVGELKSLVKPSRILSRAPNLSISTKRTSDLGNVNSRIGDAKVLSGSSSIRQSLASSKKLQMAPRSSNSNSLKSSKNLQMNARNSKPDSIPSLRPPRLSHGHIAPPGFSCAHNSKSLDSRSQSARDITGRKQDPKTSGNTLSTTSKAPSRLSKDKTVSRNPSCSTIQKSLSGSPSVSPTSSLGSMASESSSIFCGSQASYISEGSDFSSSNISIETQFDDSQQLELQKTSTAQASGTNLPHQSRTKAPLTFSGTTRLSAIDHTRSSTSHSDKTICSKPSGLRMPSPKIGYFDAEKLQNLNKRPNGFPKKTGSSVIAGESKLTSTKPTSLNAEGGSFVSSNGSQTESTKHVRGAKDAPTCVPKVSELRLPSSSTGKNSNLISELDKDLSGPLNKRNNYISHKIDEVEDTVEYALADLGNNSMKCITICPAPNDKSLNLVCPGVSHVQCKNSLHSPQAGKEEGKYIPESILQEVEKTVNEKENSITGYQSPSTCRYSDSEILDNPIAEFVGKNMSSLCLSGKEELSVAEI